MRLNYGLDYSGTYKKLLPTLDIASNPPFLINYIEEEGKKNKNSPVN